MNYTAITRSFILKVGSKNIRLRAFLHAITLTHLQTEQILTFQTHPKLYSSFEACLIKKDLDESTKLH